ncbi:MAG: hypothetical protein ACJAWV_003170 [Flammeovirgaceae bacterium]|jgi:hypothetical protein
MEIHLKFIGFLLIALALIHIIFPRYFLWKEDLAPLSLINRQMMYVHTFFVAFMVFLMGWLCLNSSSEIVETNLGRKVSLGFGVFWFVRLLIQFFGYSSKLWRGKRFETGAHIVFTLLWSYLTAIFFWVGLG